MKKIVAILLVIALVFTSIAFTPKKAQASSFYLNLTSTFKSIKVSWKKQKKAKKFYVYRVMVKDANSVFPKRSNYKKIKTVKRKRKYEDKKVKAGKLYAYYVDAVNKKGRVIATSYSKGSLECRGRALTKPEIGNGGYGEFGTNSKDELILYANAGWEGVRSKKIKYIFYRKEARESKYTKVKMHKFAYEDVFADRTVTPGKTYSYKVRTYCKKGKKKYYSPYSDVVTLSAVNFTGLYNVECLTESGIYKNTDSLDVVFKLKNADPYNGKTLIKYCDNTKADPYNDYIEVVYTAKERNYYDEKEHNYNFSLLEYSYDNKEWKTIPSKGIELPKTEAIYLKGKITRGKISIYQEKDIYFAGDDNVDYSESYFAGNDDQILEYFSNGSGFTKTYLDIILGRGEAYLMFD